jgi:hypothetical protein
MASVRDVQTRDPLVLPAELWIEFMNRLEGFYISLQYVSFIYFHVHAHLLRVFVDLQNSPPAAIPANCMDFDPPFAFPPKWRLLPVL